MHLVAQRELHILDQMPCNCDSILCDSTLLNDQDSKPQARAHSNHTTFVFTGLDVTLFGDFTWLVAINGTLFWQRL